MEILLKENIRLNQKANSREEAIRQVGQALVDSGYVESEYVESMILRDTSLSTYMGNHLSIPHGEYDAFKDVKQSGISIFIYPDGVPWNEEVAKIVIGLAATGDDHMPILSSIALNLLDMKDVERVLNSSVDEIFDIFTSVEV